MDTRPWRLKAIAISAAPLAVFVLIVLATSGVAITVVLSFVGQYLAVAAAIWGVVLVGCFVAALAKPLLTRTFEERPLSLIRRLVRERWDDDYFLSLIWPMLVFALVFGCLTVFKQTVLRRHGFADDAVFASWDKALFFGVQPWRLTHALPSPWTSLILGRVYAFWYVPVIGLLLPCAFLRNVVEFRARYLLAFVLTWGLVGGLLAWLLPSAGPCYAEAFHPGMTDYRPLMASLHEDHLRLVRLIPGARFFAHGAQAYLLQLHRSGALGFGGGISAMPSMHVAQATLFAAAAFRVGRVLGWISAIYAGLVFMGSVHLGWHYAVDGLVGGSAALAIWFVCHSVVTRVLAGAPNAEVSPNREG